MSPTVFPHVEQRSEEWYEQRRGMVTASVVGQLLTPTLKVADNDTSRALTMQLVAERITGRSDDSLYVNRDMERGILEEPRARDLYANHFKVDVEEVGFMVYEFDDGLCHLGYSPDGLVGNSGLLEVKCPRPKTHVATILADEVPARHMAQIQAGLWVSGREWCDFMSFCGGMPPYFKRVEYDTDWHSALVAAVRAFEENARAIVATYRDRTNGLPIPEHIDYWTELEIH